MPTRHGARHFYAVVKHKGVLLAKVFHCGWRAIAFIGLAVFIFQPKDSFRVKYQDHSAALEYYRLITIKDLNQYGAVEAQLRLQKLFDKKHIPLILCEELEHVLGVEAINKY